MNSDGPMSTLPWKKNRPRGAPKRPTGYSNCLRNSANCCF